MNAGPLPRPLQFLLRKEDPEKLLALLQRLAEGLSAACADSAKKIPAVRENRPAVSARGTVRRWLMHEAFIRAAEQAGYPVARNSNVTGTWTFPVIRLGAFSITVGVVDRPYTASTPRLRSRGQYVRDLVERNRPLNPMADMFGKPEDAMPSVIPNGAFGGLMVVEPSLWVPDTPSFIGFLVPSPDLRGNYFRCSLDFLIRHLRNKVAATKKPKRAPPQRKPVGLKRKKPQGPQG